MSRNFYLFTLILISLNSVLSQTSLITTTPITTTSTTTTTTTTTTINTSTPSIQSVPIQNENKIKLIWTPNRVTTTNTRYRINVISKNNTIPSFEYPGI